MLCRFKIFTYFLMIWWYERMRRKYKLLVLKELQFFGRHRQIRLEKKKLRIRISALYDFWRRGRRNSFIFLLWFLANNHYHLPRFWWTRTKIVLALGWLHAGPIMPPINNLTKVTLPIVQSSENVVRINLKVFILTTVSKLFMSHHVF